MKHLIYSKKIQDKMNEDRRGLGWTLEDKLTLIFWVAFSIAVMVIIYCLISIVADACNQDLLRFCQQ